MTSEASANGRILSRIRWKRPYMNPALRRIADAVLKSPSRIKSISIKDLAASCDVSESTVTRFVREIEAPSFQQLKVMIAEDLSQSSGAGATAVIDKHVYEDITDADDTASIMRKVASRYIVTVEDTLAELNANELEKAVEAIESSGMLAFFAMGSSVLAVENALLRFMRVGKPCQFFRDLGTRQISTATLDGSSLAIGVSNSGRSISTVDGLKSAKAQGARTICITSFPDSPIVRYSDIQLYTNAITGATGSAEYHESMVSKIAQLQVIDVLYSLYAVRNFGRAIEGLTKTSELTSLTRY